MGDLGVELDPEQGPFPVLDGHHRHRRRRGGRLEASRHFVDAVAVRHPDALLRLEPREQAAVPRGQGNLRAAVLAHARRHDAAAEHLGHPLHAVADAEDRNAKPQQFRIGLWRVFLVDAVRTAREHDADGLASPNLVHGQVERVDLAVDPELPHPSCDQLGVLAAEVEDENGLVLGHRADSTLSSRAIRSRIAAAGFLPR